MDPLQKQQLDDTFDAFTMLSNGGIVSLMHVEGGFTRYTKSGVDLFGLPGEYIPNGAMDWTNWVHPDDRDYYLGVMGRLIDGTSQTYDLNYRVKTVTGDYVDFRVVGAVLRDSQGKPSLIGGGMFNEGVANDIDPITALPNRNAYQSQMASLIAEGKGSISMMIGVSEFTSLYSKQGYSYGNRILQEMGWLIQEVVGDRGKVYRFEGAAFAILSETLKRTEMAAIYDHIRYELQRGIEVNGVNNILMANGGLISSFSSDSDAGTIYSCLKYAYDESANHMHGDLVDFNGSANYELEESLELISAIRESVSNGCEGFHLEYLPVASVANEHVNGAEATVYWENEQFGKVNSSDFIPVLERDFVFEEVGDFIFEQAFSDGMKFLEKDPNFLLCINIYRGQLEADYFVDNLLHYLRESGFPSHLLSVKFDSDCRNVGIEQMRKIIDKLHEHDILAIIGDFGTGADSIGFLKQETVDAVSIESALVGDIEHDERERDVLSNLAQIARSYVEHVNVKGVDSEALREIAATLPITTMQGKRYFGPLSFDELMEKCYSD